MTDLLLLFPYLGGLAALLFLSGFFSGSETALFSLSRTQARRMRKGSLGERFATRLLRRPRQLLSTLLLGNMLVNIMAASLAEGESTIENAASDPEIVDFVELLGKMGARVTGAGTRTVSIRGVQALHGAEHTVMHDRLDAGLLLMASGMTGGDVAIKGVESRHLRIVEAKVQQMGVRIQRDGDWTRVRGPGRLTPINVVTTYYPGFPTDLQPSIMALSCVAEGDSYIRETVFEDRLGHVENLLAFGGDLVSGKDRLVIVHGPARLHAAEVRAHDIRAGGACVLAALGAEGTSRISNLYQLDRGYADLERRLQALGARISRVP